jgi:hypothetical protein
VGWPLSKRGLSLAKFGYRLERKVEKFRNPVAILSKYGNMGLFFLIM